MKPPSSRDSSPIIMRQWHRRNADGLQPCQVSLYFDEMQARCDARFRHRSDAEDDINRRARNEYDAECRARPGLLSCRDCRYP